MSEGPGVLPKKADRWLEALGWHTELSEMSEAELTSARIRDWQRWYAEPECQRVFEQLDQLLAERHTYRERRRRLPVELDADLYDPSVPIREWRQNRSAAPMEHVSGPRRQRWWIKALAGPLLAIAATLSAVLILRPQWLGIAPGGPSTALYQTGVGQLESLKLSDGSTVTLGARSRLTVHFTAQRRAVRLLRGEAWFRDRDIPNRPFIVTAGNGTITAVGTAFVVNRDSDRVVVTVTSGTVDVSTVPPAPRLRSISSHLLSLRLPNVRVVRGEGLTYTDRGALGPVTRISTQAATAWTHGQFIFDDVPLRYVVENVDRYWSRRIAISPRAGRLRFSGIVHEDGIHDWLDGLSIILPVALEETRSSVCIHMRGPILKTHKVTSCTDHRRQ